MKSKFLLIALVLPALLASKSAMAQTFRTAAYAFQNDGSVVVTPVIRNLSGNVYRQERPLTVTRGMLPAAIRDAHDRVRSVAGALTAAQEQVSTAQASLSDFENFMNSSVSPIDHIEYQAVMRQRNDLVQSLGASQRLLNAKQSEYESVVQELSIYNRMLSAK